MKEKRIKRKKGKVHLKEDDDGSTKNKENLTQNNSNPQWMTQRPSYEKISQTRDWNRSKWWWCGPKTKGKYKPPRYRYHNTSAYKGKASHRITNKEDKKVTIQAEIYETKG